MHKCFKGGTNGTRQEDILRYNGATDKWLNVGKMKNPRSFVALLMYDSVFYDGMFYDFWEGPTNKKR